VAKHAYLSLWLEDAYESTLLRNFQQFLETVPFSVHRPGFTELVVRAISPAEAPLLERDLRGANVDAAAVTTIIAEQFHSDSSYEVSAWWDLWAPNTDSDAAVAWRLQPQPLLIFSNGQDYDDGIARDLGNIQADIGFEEFFTGGGGMDGAHKQPDSDASATATHDSDRDTKPGEPNLAATMARGQTHRIYREKTAANVRMLMDWRDRARAAVDVNRIQLWSEGEEDFEARLEEILAAR
jgi:hypothetical protein